MLTVKDLSQHLKRYNCQCRVASIGYLDELHNNLESKRRQGLLSETFYQEWLAGFNFQPPQDFDNARSIIMTALPQPKLEITFEWNGEEIHLAIPPTYLFEELEDRKVEVWLHELLTPHGYSLRRARLPKKLLAASSGLGVYGRNNICYVSGFGSYHRLTVFYSDLPAEAETWQEPRMADLCQDCSLCQRRCPTGAIDGQRFLIYAEKCLTFHNEKSGDIPYPDWLDASTNPCLVGCLQCQQSCPLNKAKGWTEKGPHFTQAETELLVKKTKLQQLSAQTRLKLEKYDLVQFLDIIPRNLGVFLH